MSLPTVKRRVETRHPIELNQQGANALLAATFEFLRRNRIEADSIIEFTKKYHTRHHGRKSLALYQKLVSSYDDMGVIMATWFSDPKFLDPSGQPRPLSLGRSANSIENLIRASGARVKMSVAVDLMRQSPSVKIEDDGIVFALRRVFVLPRFAIPRAAFVVKRYLETLQKNFVAKKGQKPLLLERSCYVSEADLTTISPMLRDIDGRGTAFMDSIDGEIEAVRLRRSKGKPVGELGVLVFAWTTRKTSKKKVRRSNKRK